MRKTSGGGPSIDSNATVAPGATVALAPGGKHLMLMHPRGEVGAGAKVEVVFLLADGRRVTTYFDVVAPDSSGD